MIDRRRVAQMELFANVRNRTWGVGVSVVIAQDQMARVRPSQNSSSIRRLLQSCFAGSVWTVPMTRPKKEGPVVLVVEDECLIRLQAITMVEEAGYQVMEAANADDAIALLEARKDIRIVFTDIEMPGSMDGMKLARAIRDRWPPVELLITSGRHIVETDKLPSRGQFLPKPYSFDVLVTALGTLAP